METGKLCFFCVSDKTFLNDEYALTPRLKAQKPQFLVKQSKQTHFYRFPFSLTWREHKMFQGFFLCGKIFKNINEIFLIFMKYQFFKTSYLTNCAAML